MKLTPEMETDNVSEKAIWMCATAAVLEGVTLALLSALTAGSTNSVLAQY